MQAAISLFAAKGYHNTTVADIIKHINVARGTFYRYFKDKNDLFSQLLENNFRYIKRVLAEVQDKNPHNIADLEVILSRSFIELMKQDNSRDFVSIMVNEATGADVVFAQKIQLFYDELAEVFGTYIARVRNTDTIKNMDPRISAYLMLGALKEIFIQWARGDKFDDLEIVLHDASSFIVNGMKAVMGAGA